MKKYWLTLALILIAVIGKSQNPTIIVAGTNISINPPSGVGKVTINATGGGGAFPAAAVSNITSSTLTVTGQGTHIINLEAPPAGSGTVTNVLTAFPWLTTSGAGTAVITISTNSVKIPSGNLEPMVLTNLTLANTPYLSLSGLGTSTITITGNGTVVTNNASPTFGTINGLTPANLATNISNTIPWVTLTGTGGNSYLFATNSTKIPVGNIDSGFALLASPNVFTATNTFNAPTFFNGASNIFSSAPFMVGTNSPIDPLAMATFRTTPGKTIFYLYGDAVSGYPTFQQGDASSSSYYSQQISGSSFLQSWNHVGPWEWSIAGVTKLSLGQTTYTIGDNSSFATTINGSTLTTAHELNWNSGVLRIPTSSTGTITNGIGGIVSHGTVQATNLTSILNAQVGTLNGLTSANFVTNIADGTTGMITFSGRGGNTYTPTINAAVITNITAGTSQLIVSGQGTRTHTITPNGTFITNGHENASVGTWMASSLRTSGSLWMTNQATTTTNYLASTNQCIFLLDTSSQNVVLSLPAASTCKGWYFVAVKLTANGYQAAIDPNGSETLNGVTNFAMPYQYDSVKAFSTGTEFIAIK